MVWSPHQASSFIGLASLFATSAALAAAAPLASPPSAAPPFFADTGYEALRWKGLEVDLSGPADTIDGQAGGLRASLAAQGIGYIGTSFHTVAQNTLDVARTTNGQQLYSGQRPTYFTTNFLVLTYDTGRIGLLGGQIAVGATLSHYTWKSGGPDKVGVLTATYYQPLLDDRVEIKAGYLINSFEFSNIFVGGNLATGVFGTAGNILYQGGFNGAGVTTPGVETTFNATPNLYTKAAVERPISPDGTIVEAQQDRSSVALRVPNTGVLVVDETGYRVPAADDRKEVWVRGAFAANSSRYVDYAKPSGQRVSGENYFAYLLADYQVTQPDPAARAARGIYVRGTFNYAPADLNRLSALYQGRIYAKGVFDSRPSDLISVVASKNVFSDVLYTSAISAGMLAHASSLSITASYGLHLAAGIFLNVGLTYVDHPTIITYTPRTGSALVAQGNLSLIF